MAGEIELSQEQIAALLDNDAVKAAIEAQAQTLIDTAVAEKNEEIQQLSNQVGDLQSKGYEQIVKSAIGTYRQRGDKGVPPIILEVAEKLMLSFGVEEQNQTIELSVGTEAEPKTEEVNKVMAVTRMLDEMMALNLSGEKGHEDEEEVELSKEQRTEAVQLLVGLTNQELANQG